MAMTVLRSALPRVTVALGLVVAAFGFVTAYSGPAHATNFGSTACTDPPDARGRGCVSVANNIYHAATYVNLGETTQAIPGLPTAMTAALADLNGTALVAYRDESDPLPDIRVQDWNWGALSGVVAWTECPVDHTGEGGTNPHRWCRGQRLKFNVYYWVSATNYYDTPSQRQNVTCHELGHSVGLRHRADSFGTCMWTHAGDFAHSRYDDHDRAHINGYYG